MTFRILFLTLLTLSVTTLTGSNITVAQEYEDDPDLTYYVDPTLSNYAKSYWRLKKFDIEDDLMVDHFMMITECDLFSEFIHNEFEWSSIREAARKFIGDNIEEFPIHYQFVQSISLGEYDFERKGFNIANEHALRGVRRFRMDSDELNSKVCEEKKPIVGYPKAIALELTRPFVLTFFPYEEERAKDLIARKMREFENLDYRQKGRDTYLSQREVYLVMKVKLFAYKTGDKRWQHGHFTANVLGILEEIALYEDSELVRELYKKDYRIKKKTRKKQF